MKCCCKNCAFGGGFKPKDKLADCYCEENPDRITKYCEFWEQDKQYVKRNEWEEEVECEYFVPEVEPTETEFVSHLNITYKCPYCGKEEYEYDMDMEDEMTIICEECGKKYNVKWCMY